MILSKGPFISNCSVASKQIQRFFKKCDPLGIYELYAGPYGKQETDNLNRIMKDHLDVKEKHILIIGSESPWIETMALRLGASHVTTGQSFSETQIFYKYNFLKNFCQHDKK